MSFLLGGPVVGALCAIALGATGSTQIILGAVLGEGVAVVLMRVWSDYAVARATRRALDAARRPTRDAPVTTRGDARPTNVFIRATGLTWRDHVVTVAAFGGFAVVVGAVVALAWRTVGPGH